MAKHTNLEIVNKVLAGFGGDEVTTIDDTREAQRILEFLEDVYYETVNQGSWPHLNKFINLQAATSAYPNYLTLPEHVIEVQWIKYDVRMSDPVQSEFREIEYCDPLTFCHRVLGRDNTAANVQTITDYDGADLYILNDQQPNFWTSFDDENVVFDAWDASLDSEMRSDKSRALVSMEPQFQRADSFIVDLPSRAFPGLIAEVKSTASLNLRQAVDEKAEQQSRRQRHQRSRRKGGKVTDPTTIPDYGRRGAGLNGSGRLTVGRRNRYGY